jgi:hypothetical protein
MTHFHSIECIPFLLNFAITCTMKKIWKSHEKQKTMICMLEKHEPSACYQRNQIKKQYSHKSKWQTSKYANICYLDGCNGKGVFINL